jgi:hypothetical protein
LIEFEEYDPEKNEENIFGCKVLKITKWLSCYAYIIAILKLKNINFEKSLIFLKLSLDSLKNIL